MSLFFFFKKKTAYEMRISDWSSDVCSSDLSKAAQQHRKLLRRAEAVHNIAAGWADRLRARAIAIELSEAKTVFVRAQRGVVLSTGGFIFNRAMVAQHAPKFLAPARHGSEEERREGKRRVSKCRAGWCRTEIKKKT